jgi:hypothetical protein
MVPPPGPVAILAVVIGGFMVCVAVFHGLRFHAARRLHARAIGDLAIQRTIDTSAS